MFSYRKKIVFENLKNSFPEKSKDEIKIIAKKFYKHLADITLESIKGYTMKPKELVKRFKLIDNTIEKKFYEQNKDVILVSSHYGNWEWGPRAAPYILAFDIVVLYKPLKNKYIDKYMNELRKKDNAKMQSIFTTGRAFVNHNKPYSVVMLSDQTPSNLKKAFWTEFLNQQTPCLHGLELYAKKFKLPVIYFNINKVKRGFYQIDLQVITDNPIEEVRGQITKKYMNILEKIIIEKPEYWLWSHKRWKHKTMPEKPRII